MTGIRFRAGGSWRRRLLLGVVAAVVLAQAGTFFFYTTVTADITGASIYLGLKGASRNRLLAQLEAATAGDHGGRPFAVDSETPVMAKIASFYTRGRPLYYLSLYPFTSLIIAKGNALVESLYQGVRAATRVSAFVWRPLGLVDELTLAAPMLPPPGTRFDLLTTSRGYSIFNRVRGVPADRGIEAVERERISNHLVFLSSTYSESYYLPKDRKRVGFWGNESDWFYPGQPMAGVGRRLLFRVVNPTPHPRLLVEMTNTLAADGRNLLPPATLAGADSAPLGLIGRGSARVYAGPVDPQTVQGEALIGIDMNAEPTAFRPRRRGLMRLFGNTINLDPRTLVGFARDISLVSDEEYRAMEPPRLLSAFPADLADKRLEYSGLYEDGWVAEAAFVRLAGSPRRSVLAIDGIAPKIAETSKPPELTVLLDGREIERRVLPFGRFAARAVLPPSAGPRRIDLRFDRVEQLPGGDDRPVAVKLERLGWDEAVLPARFEPGEAMLADPLVAARGVWSDGWLAGRAGMTLAGGAAARLELVVHMPRIALETLPLTVRVDGAVAGTRTLTPGDNALSLPLPAAGEAGRRIDLEFGGAQALAAPDTREAAAQLRRLDLVPAPGTP